VTTMHMGTPISRVDGPAKVTGKAKYAADYESPNLVHGHVVSSGVAKGRITSIDAREAAAVPGVVAVFTHENIRNLSRSGRKVSDDSAPNGTPFRPLQNGKVAYSTQPVALVVADTVELARHAASLVRIEYQREAHATDLKEGRAAAHAPKGSSRPTSRGHAAEAFRNAAIQIEAEYVVPAEHHNPMELFAATVVPDDDGGLTVFDKTQGVLNVQDYLCRAFGYRKSKLRVVSPFVGGAFGSGLRPQYHVFLAVLACRELRRPVRVSLTRPQMFSFGYRPATWQRVAIGASRDGRLEALIHEAVGETSRFEDFTEDVVGWSGLLYKCDNVKLDYKVTALDVYTPIDMRAPGASWGVYALECSMDELAVKLDMDPIDLRLRNYAERDQTEDKPFSSKELRACYEEGARRFDWGRRNPRPRSMREGHSLIGWGMASGVWEAMQEPATAKAVLTADGKLTVTAATSDIGTGTYTVMTQIAAETLGLRLEDVTFRLGDSSFPDAPVQGGSFTVSSVGSAVQATCEKLRRRLFRLAQRIPESPFAGGKLSDMTCADGQVRSVSDPSRVVSVGEVMRQGSGVAFDAEATVRPLQKRERYAHYTHSAVFAEVRVDEDFGTILVTRVVSAIAGGRILNPKTARSQILGAVVWGIGMALQEESVMDHTFGRFITRNLADYHVPVNADARDIEVIFVEERDDLVNPLGAKGLGEIGLVGTAAAIANAVFHATGRRIRDLPITPDKLVTALG
jgi:xanthine dehydrogenase YagR molybdenum-binding subunit